jgi:hypothetical protein
MLARVYSCAVIGLDGVVVEVEVDTTQGFPGMTIVGLPDAAVSESRERVQAAVRNAGVAFPRLRLVVNLAPASVRMEGLSYDLPIALGVLIHAGVLPPETAEGMLVVGELSLDGSVRHARGILPMAATARATGFTRLVVPQADAAEAALIPGLEVIPVASLSALYAHLAGRDPILPQAYTEVEDALIMVPTDFRGVRGQEHVKRALEVAAAGSRQDPAGARPARDPAAHVDRRSPGRDAGLLGRRPAPAGDADDPPPAVPLTAPHHQPRRAGGRRKLAASGGNLFGPSRCSISGRAARIQDAGFRGTASAA